MSYSNNMKYIDEVLELDLPLGKYVIIGSGPIAVRGLRENNDVDILADEDLWDSFAEEYGSSDGNVVEIGHISLYKNLLSFAEYSPEEIISDAEIIIGLPFMKLKYVVSFKRWIGRDKDLRDIELIEAFLESEA